MGFVPLQVISAYSLLQSTIAVPKLVTQAKKLGYKSLALTDHDVMYGAVRFYNLCKAHGIHPVIGLTLTINGVINTDENYDVILLAKDLLGYRNLMKISTLKRTVGEHQQLTWDQIHQHLKGLYLITPLNQEFSKLVQIGQQTLAERYLDNLTQFIPKDQLKIGVGVVNNDKYLRLLKLISKQTQVNLLALSPVKYLSSDQAFALKVLDTIQKGQQIPSPVKEYHSQNLGRQWLKSEANMAEAFTRVGLARAAQETANIANDCRFIIKKQQMRLPHFYDEAEAKSGHGQSSREYLKYLSEKGLANRFHVNKYEQTPVKYQKRLDHELSIIRDMGFDDYFLIVWDIVRFIRSRHITTGDGRGSAAGSLVAYVLYITDVDPIQYHLLFARFLNKERAQMPDIDLDIPDVRRDEVLQYVHDKYQDSDPKYRNDPLHEHVSQIITFDTMAAKQSVQDVGRVFGLNSHQLRQWSKAIPSVPGITLREAYRQSQMLRNLYNSGTPENPSAPLNQLLLKTAHQVEGLPRHYSTHAAGLILSDQPLVKLSPLQNGNEHLLMTQYSKNYAEQVGLLKIDFLGLRNLTLLGNVLRLVRDHVNPKFNIRKINLNDPRTLRLFQKGDTDGVFQFESSGIRQVLRKLHPDRFSLVVAVNALYRPGPIHNIDTFIERKNGQKQSRYPSKAVEKILAPTYGIIVYQEQVMLIAQVMGGFTLGEADIFRRAMSKKNHALMSGLRTKFIIGAQKKGYKESVAKMMFDYMNRFASYGFNKSHAVAYSKLAFQLAYLKAHYSTAFFAALLNSVMGNIKKTKRYLAGAHRLGVKIVAPDINSGSKGRTVKNGKLQLGLNFLHDISTELVNTIEQNRGNCFADLNDFIFKTYPYLLLEAKSNRAPNQKGDSGRDLLGSDDPTPSLFPLIYSGALDRINKINATDRDRLPRYELRSACYRIFHTINVYYQRFSGSQTYSQEYHAVQKYRENAKTYQKTADKIKYSDYLKYRQAVKVFKIHAQQGLQKHIELIRQKIKTFESLGLKITPDVRHSPLDLKRAEYYYLNFNPMNLYSSLVEPLNLIPISGLKSVQKFARIMATIKRVHEVRTKNGKLMAFADVTDGIDNISIVIFPSVYESVKNLLKFSRIIVVNGRVEKSPKLQLVADHIWPAANLMRQYQLRTRQYKRYNWRQHCCYIRINNQDILQSLYRVINQNRGPYPILIFNVANGNKFLLSSRYTVSRQAQNQLIKLLGNHNVIYK